MRQIDREHARAAGAERLHGGDDFAPAVEMAFHRIADADPADQQRGQSDDGEELRETLDIAFELRRGIVAAADVPAGFGKLQMCLRRHGFGRGIGRIVGRQAQAIMPAHQTARLQQTGGTQRVLAHQQPRTKADAAGELVGLARERGADFDSRAADCQPRARLDAEPRQQDGIGGSAKTPPRCASASAKEPGRIEHRLAEQRIGAVNRFQFDKRGLAIGGAGHGAQRGGA